LRRNAYPDARGYRPFQDRVGGRRCRPESGGSKPSPEKGPGRLSKDEQAELKAVAAALKALDRGEILEKVQRLLLSRKSWKKKAAGFAAEDIRRTDRGPAGKRPKPSGAFGFVVHAVEGKDPKGLRGNGRSPKDRMQSGILLLGAEGDGKAMILCAVTRDLIPKYSAQKLILEIAQIIGGNRRRNVPIWRKQGDPRWKASIPLWEKDLRTDLMAKAR